MNRTSKIDEMDLLLYSAMPYAEHKEIEVYGRAAEIPVKLSEKDKKRILKRIKRVSKYYERHEVYRPVRETLKRVAVVALVVLSLCFFGALSIEAVRATLWEIYIKWYEDCILVTYETQDKSVIPDRILEYKEPVVGDEYERYEIAKNEVTYVIEYESDRFLITYSQNLLTNYYRVNLSNKDTEMKDITVNGYPGIMTKFETHGITQTTIIWYDDEYAYNIDSNLGYEELLAIAKSIH